MVREFAIVSERLLRVISGKLTRNKVSGGIQGRSSQSIQPDTTGSVRAGAVIAIEYLYALIL
jgi:hypothetical protein